MFADQQDLEQEDYVMPPLKNLDFSIQPQGKIQCQTLYIAFYGVSSLYVSTLVDTKSSHAQINFQKAKQKSLASVYLNKTSQKSEAYVIFNEDFQKMREIHFADFVAQNFQFKNMLIFTSLAKGMLQKDDGVSLKYLQTSYGLDLHGPVHNQGLSGPEADLLQYCQLNSINAVCFIGIYSDYEVNRKIIDDIFGSLGNFFPLESKHDVAKQIKTYNMAKYSNKLYL